MEKEMNPAYPKCPMWISCRGLVWEMQDTLCYNKECMIFHFGGAARAFQQATDTNTLPVRIKKKFRVSYVLQAEYTDGLDIHDFLEKTIQRDVKYSTEQQDGTVLAEYVAGYDEIVGLKENDE